MKLKYLILFLFISQICFSQDIINWWEGGELPTVVMTSAVQGDNYCEADLDGNVTDDGGVAVTERGFVYATSTLPDTLDTKVVVGSGTGTFNTSVTDLNDNQIYYFRAYAINGIGISYSASEVNFTTNNDPTITASAINITPTTADITGVITANGNDITNVRIRWGTSTGSYPNSVFQGDATSPYTVNLTSLPSDATIYYRGRALISGSCSVQEFAEKSFETLVDYCDFTTETFYSQLLSDCGNVSISDSTTAHTACSYYNNVGCSKDGGTSNPWKVESISEGKQLHDPSDPCNPISSTFWKVYISSSYGSGTASVIKVVSGTITSIQTCD